MGHDKEIFQNDLAAVFQGNDQIVALAVESGDFGPDVKAECQAIRKVNLNRCDIARCRNQQRSHCIPPNGLPGAKAIVAHLNGVRRLPACCSPERNFLPEGGSTQEGKNKARHSHWGCTAR
jgi:hypothetical protein